MLNKYAFPSAAPSASVCPEAEKDNVFTYAGTETSIDFSLSAGIS